jgi:hypothetical protein
MAIDYFEDFEDFGFPGPGESASEFRAAVLEVFASCDVEVAAAELSDDALDAMPGHVLFAWMYDHDLSMSLFAIPESKLSAALRGAMSAANDLAFAYHEIMIGDDRSAAFARIDAATGVDDFDDYLEDLEEAIAGFAASVADSDRDCLSDYRIGYLESDEEPELSDGAFDRRFVAAYSVRRCE